jgi:hypothetical protein
MAIAGQMQTIRSTHFLRLYLAAAMNRVKDIKDIVQPKKSGVKREEYDNMEIAVMLYV